MDSAHKHPHKASHPLRLVLFFLRVAVGLNFFYFGFGTLFNPALAETLKQKPLGGLYAWLNSSTSVPWAHPFAAWIFMGLGICLILGFATRLAALLGIAMIVWEYLPFINFSHLNALVALNDQAIILLCLLTLFFGKAGSYLGLDRFFRFSLWGKRN